MLEPVIEEARAGPNPDRDRVPPGSRAATDRLESQVDEEKRRVEDVDPRDVASVPADLSVDAGSREVLPELAVLRDEDVVLAFARRPNVLPHPVRPLEPELRRGLVRRPLRPRALVLLEFRILRKVPCERLVVQILVLPRVVDAVHRADAVVSVVEQVEELTEVRHSSLPGGSVGAGTSL
jgi:hypothetical protein